MHRDDFVLRLAEGVAQPGETLRTLCRHAAARRRLRPGAEERSRLVAALVDSFFRGYRDVARGSEEAFVPLDEGLAVIARHARDLGYDALVLFLDELILWLATASSPISHGSWPPSWVATLPDTLPDAAGRVLDHALSPGEPLSEVERNACAALTPDDVALEQ